MCNSCNEDLEKIRHSAAHVMAAAVTELFPGTIFGIGPAIDNGFYYDFDSPHKFVAEDLPVIEKKMREIIKRGEKFVCENKSKAEALKTFGDKGEKYKVELINDLEDGAITFYTNGSFTDLCRGPHVESTSKIKHFKLTHIAGAYWRGDEKRPMLQRIYGLAFLTKEDLDAYIKMQEEALKRDHRKLGKDMDIFHFDDDVGPGLALWLPNGGILIEEIEKLAKETEDKAGYKRVKTPHITKEKLFLTSGHLPYYEDSMYPPMEVDGQKYYLKPMNCPFHHKIFDARLKSYRDLPLRLAEYGTCYRYEQSGELFGLMRVRAFTMNDAHIYCTPEQFETEFLAVSQMYLNYFKTFGIEKYIMRFSTHAPQGLGKKYVDMPELWQQTEAMAEKALKNGKLNYVKVADEAAFYGPKIDVQIYSAIGREFTLATNQVDFLAGRNFNLIYKDKDGQEKHPLVIHRAPLSTHERLIGFLLEHFAGVFPLWLAPVQITVASLSDKEEDYAKEVYQKMTELGIRAQLDIRSEKLGHKIRESHMAKVPYMAIIGGKEAESRTLTIRLRSQKNLNPLPLDQVLATLKKEIEQRSLNNLYS